MVDKINAVLKIFIKFIIDGLTAIVFPVGAFIPVTIVNRFFDRFFRLPRAFLKAPDQFVLFALGKPEIVVG